MVGGERLENRDESFNYLKSIGLLTDFFAYQMRVIAISEKGTPRGHRMNRNNGMLAQALFALLSVACAAPSAPAQEARASFTDHLFRQVVCQSPPDPTATLLYLSRNRHIDAKKGVRADSETCWIIYPPLEIDGIAFTHICGSAEDALLIELFPLFYYRGPGTSPGTVLRLVTNDDEAAVDEWIERAKNRTGIKGETKLDIGSPSFVTGKTEISCSSKSFPSGE